MNAYLNKRPAQLLPPGMERLLGIADLAANLHVGRRTVERLRTSGRLPRADLDLGDLPRWRPKRWTRWVEGGGR